MWFNKRTQKNSTSDKQSVTIEGNTHDQQVVSSDRIQNTKPIPPEGITAPHANSLSSPTPSEETLTHISPVITAIDAHNASSRTTLDASAPMSNEAAKTILEMRTKAKRKKRLIAGACGVLLVIVIGASAAATYLNSNKPTPTQIATAPVTKEDFTSTVKAQGSAQPSSSTVITPEVEGIIDEVFVSEGSYVHAGDTLFTIKNADLDQAVADAQDGVAMAKKAYAQAQDACARAQQAYERALAAYNNAPTAEAQAAMTDPDQVYEQYIAAQNAQDQAKVQLKQAQAQATKAQEHAAKRVVKAPIDGSIITMNAKKGAGVGMSAMNASSFGRDAHAPLMQIADMSKLRLRIQVSEMDISSIQAGQPAKVRFSALPDVSCTARVDAIANISQNAESGMADGPARSIAQFNVDMIVDNPDPSIKIGMSADVVITTKEIKDALCVPTAAIYDSDGKTYVDVVKNPDAQEPEFEQKEVQVLARGSGTCAITGVSESDIVRAGD